MEVYLKSYLRENLGDDLFVKIISERYPNTIFKSFGLKKLKNKNVKIKSGYGYVFLNKALDVLTKSKLTLDRYYMKKYDKTIMLGGSMFMQYRDYIYPNVCEKELKNKDYYIIGANFGPYKTKEYLEGAKKFIGNSKDVCFRDKNSYNLFKEFSNVRYNPDIVFSLNIDDIKIKEENKVVISVIDCNRKNCKNKTNEYEDKILELIRYFTSNGYNIVLISFCKFQGDEIAINRILKKCSKEDKKNINKYYYRGNINEALNIIASSKIVIGSRFHANILGLLFNKTIIPIAYTRKTIDVLKDIDYKGKIIDINIIEKFNIKELTQEDLNYKINTQKEKENASKHFEELDKVLK